MGWRRPPAPSHAAGSAAAVDVAAVADPDDQDHEPGVLHGVDDPPVADTDTVEVPRSRQLLAARRTRILGQGEDGGLEGRLNTRGELA